MANDKETGTERGVSHNPGGGIESNSPESRDRGLFLACGETLGYLVEGEMVRASLRNPFWGGSGNPILHRVLLDRWAEFADQIDPSSLAPLADAPSADRPRGLAPDLYPLFRPLALDLLSVLLRRGSPFLSKLGLQDAPLPQVALVACLAGRAFFLKDGGDPVPLKEVAALFLPGLSEWGEIVDSLRRFCRSRTDLVREANSRHPAFHGERVWRLGPEGLRAFGIEKPRESHARPSRREEPRDPPEEEAPQEDPAALPGGSGPPGLDALALSASLEEPLRFEAEACRADETYSPVLLFAGPPGTGKTYAAQAFAAQIGRPVHATSLPEIYQKYVGETESRLARAFDRARRSRSLLLLDEADALLFDRASAERAWELSTVNTLLKLLEEPGVPVVLCTNLAAKLDTALHRRVTLLLEFPVPDPPERRRIWRMELERAKLAADLDLDALAAVRLTGGLIRSAVLAAARRRSVLKERFQVTTAALLDLASREAPKLGSSNPERAVIFAAGGRVVRGPVSVN